MFSSSNYSSFYFSAVAWILISSRTATGCQRRMLHISCSQGSTIRLLQNKYLYASHQGYPEAVKILVLIRLGYFKFDLQKRQAALWTARTWFGDGPKSHVKAVSVRSQIALGHRNISFSALGSTCLLSFFERRIFKMSYHRSFWCASIAWWYLETIILQIVMEGWIVFIVLSLV